MNESDDEMTTPITRGEFKQEMAKLDAKLEVFFGAVMARFEAIDRRFEAIDRRFDELERCFIAFRADVNTRFDAVQADLARHTAASAEQLRADVGAVDDKYNDLPPRVTKLEVAVFPRPPSRRAVVASPKKRRRKAS